jgi:hypothetical protein
MQVAAIDTDQKLITDKFEMYWLNSDTFYIHLFKDSYSEIEDIKKNVAFQAEQNVGADHNRIIHAEKFASISKQGREFLQKTAPTVRREAYVMPSLSQKIIFNLYVKFRRNPNPIRAFDKLEDALTWLNNV